MIFRPWKGAQFEEAGFVQVGALSIWECCGFPLYSSSRDPNGAVWIPGWAVDLFYGIGAHEYSDSNFDGNLARLSAVAIRSDDPDAFIESVLAAYALGGWHAALQLAGAQDEAHAVSD